MKNHVTVVETEAKSVGAPVSRNPKLASSTFHDVIKFYQTCKGLHLGKIKWMSTMKLHRPLSGSVVLRATFAPRRLHRSDLHRQHENDNKYSR